MAIRMMDSCQGYVRSSDGTTDTTVARARGFFAVSNGFNPPKFTTNVAPGTSAAQAVHSLLDDICVINPYIASGFEEGIVFGCRMTKPVGIAGFMNPAYAFFGLYPNTANQEHPIAVYDDVNNFSGALEDGFSYFKISVNQSLISGTILVPWVLGDWKYFEVGYYAATGEVALRVDGVEYFRSGGHSVTITQIVNLVALTGQVGALTGGNMYFQDFYVADVLDGFQFFGPCQVLHVPATDDVETTSFVSEGGGALLGNVNELFVDYDQSQIRVDRVGAKALFTGNIGANSALAVQVTNIMANRGALEESDLPDASVKALFEVDGEEVAGTTYYLPCREQNSWDVATSTLGGTDQPWINIKHCSQLAPGGAAWTSEKLSSLRFGVKTVGLVEIGDIAGMTAVFGLQVRPYYSQYPGLVQVRVEGQSSGLVEMNVHDSTTSRVVKINQGTNEAEIASQVLTGLPAEVNYLLTVHDNSQIKLHIYDASDGSFFDKIVFIGNNTNPISRSIEVVDALPIPRMVWTVEGFESQVTIT